MKHKELTFIINSKLRALEDKVKSRPQGGDFNGLRKFLSRLVDDVREFESLLDELEWRMPS